MKNILGIGKAGFNIVKELGKHKNYKPFVISKHVTNKTKYRYPTPDLDSPEDFENLDFEQQAPQQTTQETTQEATNDNQETTVPENQTPTSTY